MRRIPLQRVLCATDLSADAGRVLEAAGDIAGWSGADLTVLHCVTPGPASPVAPVDRDALTGQVRALLARGPLPSQAGVVIREGAAGSEIGRLARALRPDLLVLGGRGKGAGQAMGPIARAVASTVAAPVLLVPPAGGTRDAGGPFRQIVCAVDFSPASRGALDHALSLALEYRSALLLVHVRPAQHEAAGPAGVDGVFRAIVERLHAAVPDGARAWIDPYAAVTVGDPARRIVAMADRVDADLIVLGRATSGSSGNPLGGVIPEVVGTASCAVLVAPPSRTGAAAVADVAAAAAAPAMPQEVR
jgi:nucleotide-binding universal stress UspA family protein